ncbi:MAG: type IV secretory system conjugative DNA transfer family protein [Acidimicrobiales bacterium]
MPARPDVANGWSSGLRRRRGAAGSYMVSRGGSGSFRSGVLPGSQGVNEPARWARSRDVQHLVVKAPAAGRITLGTMDGLAGSRVIAAERGHSLLVAGPTQSGKTTGLAIPAILEWEGPVLAASVKSDLALHTIGQRLAQGQVHIYDPTCSSGLGNGTGNGLGAGWSDLICGWTPLAYARDWQGARKMARALTEAAKSSASGMADADFWYATAMKLLAPHLLAAAATGRTMADVVRWLDCQEIGEVADILDALGISEACAAAEASWRREERQRSSVYTTAETILEPFSEPDISESEKMAHTKGIPDPRVFLTSRDTLYLCAPAHDQRRCRALLSTAVSHILQVAYELSLERGAPLDPPLLVVVDEAANVAPLAELDSLASTAASHGVQLVTVWQDLAQLNARYGVRAASVVNNHRAKMFCSGISDVATLEQASQLAGEAANRSTSSTYDRSGYAGATHSSSYRRLLPADMLRRMPPGWAVLMYGNLHPVALKLRPALQAPGIPNGRRKLH